VLGNRKVVFNLDVHNIPGVPDGMTMDTDGNLWVAVFDGGCLLHINPRTSELISTINFPARQVLFVWVFFVQILPVTLQITAAAFGGPNLDELYVTSAQLVVNGVKQAHPAGAVFRVTGTGARGQPGVKVKIPK
jgi:gluconolactonase